ncbi:MAG TPA: methionine--tRNA ligase, partial [Candidatus Hodarchaeales archaeon]|nr:methionine--tRNA ligase [Candidatus Hodarchaeales archaeon]
DRFVRGTCPNCGYENARGDQCESCTRVLDPKDLLNPRSAISGSQKIVVRESKHLFLNLPKVQDKIAGWIETKKDRWPKTSYSIAKKWINEGIQSRSITRDLKWGIAVPIAGYESKVIYVWVDAPIGYISATIQWARSIGNPDLWQSYWKDPSTKLVQFMGKDNVPFHTVTWPATMIGADDGFVLADIVKGFEWLNYEGSKFSTSQKRGVFLDQALETFPADCWRYYLLLVAPERHDTDFTWAGFQQAVNNDLANVLGNFIHRTLTFILREFNGAIPSIGELSEQDRNVLNAVKTAVNDLRQQFGDLEFQKAVAVVRQFWSICNTYFQDVQPWRLVKEDKSRASTVLGVCAYLCYVAAIISQPSIPETSYRILEYLGLGFEEARAQPLWDEIEGFLTKISGKIVGPDVRPLFAKIEDKQVQILVDRFKGDVSATQKATDVKGRQKKLKEDPTGNPTSQHSPKGLTFEQFQQVDIRVGRVISCESVPKSKNLLKFQVELGEGSPRQILAGLANNHKPEDLIDKQILVVSNLAIKTMKGLESKGMILAAETDVASHVFKIILVDKALPVGSKLS